MLFKALESVISQLCESAFTYEVIVVDNDCQRSAKKTVGQFQINNKINIIYDCESDQSISLARNRAIKNATGNFLVFMDDDECPEPNWLLMLYRAYYKFQVDGVLGPVLPFFRELPPEWLLKSKLCVRSSFPTGTMLRDSKYMRTGNVFFSRKIIENIEIPFDPRFGRTGGEDVDFFDRMLRAGYSFVWCDEAQVKEEVPAERQRLGYYIRRACLRGVTVASREAFFSYGTVKSLLAVSVYTLSLPFLALFRYDLFVKYLIKNCDHLAKLLAQCGIKLVRERTF